jgi:uncharacterized protein (TIGR02611 family)
MLIVRLAVSLVNRDINITMERMDFLKRHGKRAMLEGAGWLLIVLGLAALVLPGPGLLMLFAGLALLATQYEWAERRLQPVRRAALKAAADSVRSWPRIVMSVIFSLGLVGVGIFWGLRPSEPSWWPLADKWWLIGGWNTGGTIAGSGILALIMIVYSYANFRKNTDKRKH